MQKRLAFSLLALALAGCSSQNADTPLPEQVQQGRVPTGYFAGTNEFNLPEQALDVLARDLNGDGRVDLVSALNSQTNQYSVAVQLNQGSDPLRAIFDAPRLVATAAQPYSLASADFNGDGKPDLAVAAREGGVVTVLTNDGQANFTRQDVGAGGDFPLRVVAADVDGDQRPDLVVGLTEARILVLRNQTPANAAAPEFANPVDVITVVNAGLVDMKLGDFNQDGLPDIALSSFLQPDFPLFVFLNSTSGGTVSFRPPVTLPGTTTEQIAVVDVNTDGRPDLVTADGDNHTVSVFLSTTPAQAAAATFLGAQTVPVTDLEPTLADGVPTSVVAADFNGDGRPDLSVADRFPYQKLFLNNTPSGSSTVQLQAQATVPLAGRFTEAQAVADLNGDGRVDLVGAHTDFTLTGLGVTLNQTAANSTTTFMETVAQFPSQGLLPGAVDIADMNGDGKNDLVVVNRDSEALAVLPNTGTQGALKLEFDPAAVTQVSVGAQPISMITGDFDKDGRIDAAIPNRADDTLTVLHNTTPKGDLKTTFSSTTYAVGSEPEDVFFEDFDGDGLPELAVPNSADNTVSVLRNTSAGGDLTFAPAIPFGVGVDPDTVDTGDMDGDGKPDLLSANHGSNNISVLVNQSTPGNLAFATAQDFPVGTGPDSIYVQDFNADGVFDVGSVSAADEAVDILVNNHQGGVSYTRVHVGGFPEIATWFTGDLTGDGHRDLAVSRFDGSLQIAINTANANLGYDLRSVYLTGRAARTAWSMEIGDVNGDGVKDVVTSNELENTISVLLGI